MGWFFRRSAKLGPFRLNFSKSGIGVSAGVKGARVSTGPRGTYVNLGKNGVYYRQKVGGSYSATSSPVGAAQSGNATGQHVTSLPGNQNYPTFPKHGPPRIVKTLGFLIIPAVIILVWFLAVIGIGTSPTGSIGSNDIARPLVETAGNKSVQSSRERGFEAGLSYALRNNDTGKSKVLDQRGVKKLAAQAASMEHQDQEWQIGWIEGYNKAIKSSVATVNDNRSVRDQTTSQPRGPITIQPTPRSTSNGYIRGPRGGCYYLSGSGRKVYVDRSLCN